MTKQNDNRVLGHYAALFCAQRELEQGYLELIKEAQA